VESTGHVTVEVVPACLRRVVQRAIELDDEEPTEVLHIPVGDDAVVADTPLAHAAR
jgi:hypothetical protein